MRNSHDRLASLVRPLSPEQLTVADPVTMSGWVPGTEVDGELQLPAEALLRLSTAGWTRDHTPAYSAEGIDLDRLRKVFPGF